ncbi:MAG: glycosyltransferase [Anaerolineales bacterium]|nr:glycosyltransferase [Anaerolineales bacterium]
MKHFSGKLALQQRVLPSYRAPFFDLLASACDGGMSLFTGLPRPIEGITTTDQLQIANFTLGRNINLFWGKFYFCYQNGLLNWLKQENPDALIMEANQRYLSTPFAVKWMHQHNKPVIGWGLGAPSLRGRGAGVRTRFINQFDAMIAYSQRGEKEYAQLGFPKDKIFVAPNAVSPAPTHPLPLRSSGFDEQPTILFVGRLQARKRIDHLLRACAEIQHIKLVITGDGPEREPLERLAKEIYPQAEFLGAKHGGELKAYFEAADLFVLPGTGGLAVQEAMSYGLPIIVAQGDGTQDDLVREGNGWQIPPEDFDALVSTMKDALSDAARLRRMGAESYRIVKDEINIEKMVDVFTNVLNLLTVK